MSNMMEAYKFLKEEKFVFRQRLGHHVGWVFIRVYLHDTQISLHKYITNKVMSHINMLGALMEHLILGEIDSTLTITK